MAGFEKCCYYIDLSLGCYIIAGLYLIFCISSVIFCSMDVRLGQARLCYLAWGENYTLNTFMKIVFEAAVISSGLMLVFVGLFIYGLNSDRGQVLLLFMAYLLMYHTFNFLLLMIAACYVNSWFIFFMALLSIGVGALWLLTVYSEYSAMPTMDEE